MTKVIRPNTGLIPVDPCEGFDDSATLIPVFAFGDDGNWNFTIGLTITDADLVDIQFRDGSGFMLGSALFNIGDDMVNDAPITSLNWGQFQPFLTGDGAGPGPSPLIIQDGAQGSFAKLLWAEDNNRVYENADVLEMAIIPRRSSGACIGNEGSGDFTVQRYNGRAGNPFQIDGVESDTLIFRAHAGDNILKYDTDPVADGRSEDLVIRWDQMVLPAGVTGTVTNVDLLRGLQVSDVQSSGEYDFFAMGIFEGLTAGGNPIDDKVTVVYCEHNGAGEYIPTLIYHNANANSTRQIQITGRKINGRDVCQVGSTSRVIWWNGSSWQVSFVATSFTGDACYKAGGTKVFFCSENSVVASRVFNGASDADHVSNAQWSGTSVAAGVLNTPSANGNAGDSGSAIGLGSVVGVTVIGYDGVVGQMAGSLAMLAVYDNQNLSIVFLQEQNGTQDLIQIAVFGASVIDISAFVTADGKAIYYQSAQNKLYFGNNGDTIYEIDMAPGLAVSKTRFSDENYLTNIPKTF